MTKHEMLPKWVGSIIRLKLVTNITPIHSDCHCDSKHCYLYAKFIAPIDQQQVLEVYVHIKKLN